MGNKKIIYGFSFLLLYVNIAFCQSKPEKNNQTNKNISMNTQKMKVEIWSDIICPFCYIGKRHFEEAISKFENADNIEVVWRSFQLDPSLPKPASKLNAYQYLAERKGMSYEQSVDLHKNVIEMAKQAGLNYDYDKAIVANSFDAHRLIQFAKTKNSGDVAKERLLKAYFTEGKDMSDAITLMQLGKEIGLEENELKTVVYGDDFSSEVKNDINEAQRIGVQGVPFFLFNQKYAVSGAQPSDAFLGALRKAYSDWSKVIDVNNIEIIDGKVCTPEKDCN